MANTKLNPNQTNDYILSNSLYRQAIINGNFDVWQRGTSDSTSGNGNNMLLMADRWIAQTYSGTGGSPGNCESTASRQAFTAGQTDVPGEPAYFHRYQVTTAGTQGTTGSLIRLRYRVEDVRTFAGQTATLSFYAKAESSRNMAVCARQNFGSGGSAVVDSGGGETKGLTTSWQKFTTTFTFPSISGKTIGTSSFLELSLMFYKADNDAYSTPDGEVGTWSTGIFDIAQVQLCAGDVALPFMPKSYADELRACQRYYQRIGGTGAYDTYGAGFCISSTAATIVIALVETMRIIPTAIEATTTASNYQINTGVGSVATSVVPQFNRADNRAIALWCTVASGLTTGQGCFLRNNNTTSGYIAVSAEL